MSNLRAGIRSRQPNGSGIRSQLAKAGVGANELRFDGKKETEELLLHARKDMYTLIKHARSATIAKDDDTQMAEQGALRDCGRR